MVRVKPPIITHAANYEEDSVTAQAESSHCACAGARIKRDMFSTLVTPLVCS